MVQLSRTWLRASRIESVAPYDTVRFEVRMFTGATHRSGTVNNVEAAMNEFIDRMRQAQTGEK